MKKLSLFLMAALYAISAQAGPMLPPGGAQASTPIYDPQLTCNNGALTIFQNLTDGNLIMTFTSQDEGASQSLKLTSVTKTAAPSGGSIFTTQSFGVMTIDSTGKGTWSHQERIRVTNDQGVQVVVQNLQTVVSCQPIAPVPGGFSVGN